MLSWGDVLGLEIADEREHGKDSRWARLYSASDDNLACATNALRTEHVRGGGQVAIVDGWQCHATHDLFIEFSRSLAFPQYFGYNWDAFAECLSDLLILNDGGLGSEFGDRTGVPVRQLLIIIYCTDQVLRAERENTERQKLVNSLRWAASGRAGDDSWRGSTLANLTVLFHGVPEKRDDLVIWLANAGLPSTIVEVTGDCDI